MCIIATKHTVVNRWLAWLRVGLLLLACGSHARDCNLEGYCMQPFTGTLLYNSSMLGSEPLNVSVSYALMRLMEVNEMQQTYKATIRITLAWEKAKAPVVLAQTTEGGNQSISNDDVKEMVNCKRFCVAYPTTVIRRVSHDRVKLCCDDVWLPTAIIINLEQWYPEATGSPYFELIEVLENDENDEDQTEWVQWTKEFTAVFHTRMSFQAYPYDRQALRLTMVGESINFVPIYSLAVRPSRYQNDTLPEDLQGWRIARAAVKLYGEKGQKYKSKYQDPVPRRLQLWWSNEDPVPKSDGDLLKQELESKNMPVKDYCQDLMSHDHMKRGCVLIENKLLQNEKSSHPESESHIRQSSFEQIYLSEGAQYVQFVTEITRVLTPIFFQELFPIILINVLAYTILFISRSRLENRLLAVMTLFLTLTASPFLANSPRSTDMTLPTELQVSGVHRGCLLLNIGVHLSHIKCRRKQQTTELDAEHCEFVRSPFCCM